MHNQLIIMDMFYKAPRTTHWILLTMICVLSNTHSLNLHRNSAVPDQNLKVRLIRQVPSDFRSQNDTTAQNETDSLTNENVQNPSTRTPFTGITKIDNSVTQTTQSSNFSTQLGGNIPTNAAVSHSLSIDQKKITFTNSTSYIPLYSTTLSPKNRFVSSSETTSTVALVTQADFETNESSIIAKKEDHEETTNKNEGQSGSGSSEKFENGTTKPGSLTFAGLPDPRKFLSIVNLIGDVLESSQRLYEVYQDEDD